MDANDLKSYGHLLGDKQKNKGGRPKKYGQDTVRVSLRIPADIIAAVGAISDDRSECIVSILQQWKNQSTDCRIMAFNEWWAKQYANK